MRRRIAAYAILAVTAMLIVGGSNVTPVYGAVSCTELTHSQSNVDTTSYTTASITPASNALDILFVMSAGTGNPNITVSGGGQSSWNNEVEQEWNTDKTLWVYRALSASPSSGTITISDGGGTMTGAQWSVIECTGVDTSGTNGSGAVGQVASGNTGGVNATSINLVYSLTFQSNSTTVGAFQHNANELTTQEAGLTELSDQSQGNPNTGLEIHSGQSSTTPQTSTGSWASNVVAGAAGLEVLAAPPATTTTTTSTTTTTVPTTTTTTIPATTTTTTVDEGIYEETRRMRAEILVGFALLLFMEGARFTFNLWGKNNHES